MSTERHVKWLSATGHNAVEGVYTPHRDGALIEARSTRGNYQKDYERILDSAQLARLEHIKQAFLYPPRHSNVSTRLSHSHSVAAIAATIAERVGLNVELALAGGLGHDCGHAPGGHAGEDALSRYTSTPFDHATWGALVLSRLGLSEEVLDAVRNHSWSHFSPFTPEGQVVSIADRIAYATDDLRDAMNLGLCGDATRIVEEWREGFIEDAAEIIEKYNIVGLSNEAIASLNIMRNMCNQIIYSRPASVLENAAIIHSICLVTDQLIALKGISPMAAAMRVSLMTDESVVLEAIKAGMDTNERPLTTEESTGARAPYKVPDDIDPHITPEDAAALCWVLRGDNVPFLRYRARGMNNT